MRSITSAIAMIVMVGVTFLLTSPAGAESICPNLAGQYNCPKDPKGSVRPGKLEISQSEKDGVAVYRLHDSRGPQETVVDGKEHATEDGWYTAKCLPTNLIIEFVPKESRETGLQMRGTFIMLKNRDNDLRVNATIENDNIADPPVDDVCERLK